MPNDKVMCEERRCGWTGNWDQALKAKNPFEPDEELVGCPKCKRVDTLREACDEPDYWEGSTCGTPTEGGYRRTCSKHLPEQKEKKT